MSGNISDIQPLARDPMLRSVRVSGRVAAHLPVTEVEAMGLYVGQTWTGDLSAEVQGAVARHAARRAALRLLDRRAYTSQEIVERLENRGHDEAAVRRAVDGLAADGLVDDRAFARSLGEELLGRNPIGREALVERLMRRQRVAEPLARETAEALLSARSPLDAALAYARKRLRTMPHAEDRAAARRIVSSLARRGIDVDTIQTVLDRLELPGADELVP